MKVQVASRERQAWGEDLDELLARSKIVLGIHQWDDPRSKSPISQGAISRSRTGCSSCTSDRLRRPRTPRSGRA